MFRELLIYFWLFLAITSAAKLSNREKERNYHPTVKASSQRKPQGSYPWSNTNWNQLAKDRINNAITDINQLKTNKAKNVIMFLGDGMGLPTIASARLYKRESRNVDHESMYLPWENFPFHGLSRTYNVDRSTPDSAGTATAYLCGIKANMGTIGVNENVLLSLCSGVDQNKVKSVTKHSIAAGKWTGVVTTTRVTHASPAGCYANTPDRNWEAYVPTGSEACQDIAYQLVHNPDNQDIHVILGGGVSYFLPSNETDAEYNKNGLRKDYRNLIKEWEAIRTANGNTYSYVKNKAEFNSVNVANTDYLMGLFDTSHMSYEVDRNVSRQPSLAEMTEKSINLLKRSPNGFFLFVEGGRIDHSHHDGRAFKALNDTMAMADAVDRALSLTNSSETLIVVTADHSHVYSLGGYGSFDESVFGFADLGELANDNKPYLMLHYADGPGFEYHRMNGTQEVPRKNLTGVNTRDKEFQQDAAVWLYSESHGGEDVGIYASGPWSHLFHSTQEQSYIAHVMMYASCIGDYVNETHCSPALAVDKTTILQNSNPSNTIGYNSIFLVISVCMNMVICLITN